MIRVNLLPNKKQNRKTDFFNFSFGGKGGGSSESSSDGPSQAWLGVVLGVVLVEVLVLLLVYKTKGDQLAKAKNKNLEHTTTISTIQGNIAQHEKIKADLKELREREDAEAHTCTVEP